ncbi:MAG: TrmB family transcriptional regulator [Candidatus Bathyarchaeia archaeon]|jgi:sugar-specific transcriptional regulator TrmB
MSEEAVRKVLRDFGLTEKETEIYIFVSKHGILKGGEVAKQTKTPKALVYRVLKSLQAKGVVESTLEFPARFAAVPFEEIIDLNVSSKLSEVSRLKDEKTALLNHWKQIDKPKAALPVEKFAVIDGKQKLNRKLSQMVEHTRTMLSSIITVHDLAQANYLGIFDRDKSLPPKAAFRFLVRLTDQNLDAARKLLSEIETKLPTIEVRTSEVGTGLFPQMTISDNDEAIFYITPKGEQCSEKGEELCLWTNCKSLIEAFSVIFDELYKNSVDVHTKISCEPISAALTNNMGVIDDSEAAVAKYREALRSSEKEIIVLTSCEGPSEIGRTQQLLNDLVEKTVDVKLMVPVTSDNSALAWELSKQYAVKHVPMGYLATTLIDGKHLFQFKTSSESELPFEKTFYTNDSDCLSKTKKMLTDLWEHAQTPSATTLQTILQGVDPQFSPFPKCPPNSLGAPFIVEEKPAGCLTEKEVLEKMIFAKKHPTDTSMGVIDWRYGSIGLAVIHPPPHLDLPDLMMFINKIEKQSRLGEEDAIVFLSWLKTPKGFAYAPVAIIGDNPKAHEFWKNMNAGNPAGKNTHLLRKDELEIRVHGNTLFAGWTVPVPLLPSKYTLPPACVLIEGYGDVKTTAYTVVPPPGYRILREENYLDAFVTFFYQSTKYSGPGTDGYLIRDSIITIFPPSPANAK